MYLYVTAIMVFEHLTVQSVKNSSLVITVRDVRQTILDTTQLALNSVSMDFRQKQVTWPVTWPAHKILLLIKHVQMPPLNACANLSCVTRGSLLVLSRHLHSYFMNASSKGSC